MNGDIVDCNHCLKLEIRRFDNFLKVVKSLIFLKAAKID